MLNQDTKKKFFQSFLKNEDGNMEAIGDYSFDIEEYTHKNVENKKLFISRLDILIEDNAKLRFDRYGAETVLKSGIKLYYTRKGEKVYIAGDELSIKCNRDWLQYSCEVNQHYFNNNHSFMKISFNLSKDLNQHIVLEKTESIGVELNDDFSGLENHTFHITGFHIKI